MSGDPIATTRGPIATVQKNRREELRFSLDEFKGHRFVTVRIYAPGRDGSMVPTKCGVTFRPALIAEFRPGAMQKLSLSCQLQLSQSILNTVVDRLAFADERIAHA